MRIYSKKFHYNIRLIFITASKVLLQITILHHNACSCNTIYVSHKDFSLSFGLDKSFGNKNNFFLHKMFEAKLDLSLEMCVTTWMNRKTENDNTENQMHREMSDESKRWRINTTRIENRVIAEQISASLIELANCLN